MITDLLKNIMEARLGKDVRKSIHDAIEQCYKDATSDPETIFIDGQNLVNIVKDIKNKIADADKNVKGKRDIDAIVAYYNAYYDEKVINWVANQYIDKDGYTQIADEIERDYNPRISQFIAISGMRGKILKISASAVYGNSYYSFFDAGGVPVENLASKDDLGYQMFEGHVVVPSDAEYIVISHKLSSFTRAGYVKFLEKLEQKEN